MHACRLDSAVAPAVVPRGRRRRREALVEHLNFPAGSLDPRRIAAIAAIGERDRPLRNFLITSAYHELSHRLGEVTGTSDQANWCTFSKWSSLSLGPIIRDDHLTVPFYWSLRKWWIGRLRRPLIWLITTVRRWLHLRSSRAIARGNREIFFEIGLAIMAYVTAVEAGDSTDAVLADPNIPLALREGLRAYDEARRENRPDKKAEWLLTGNIRIAEHEQRVRAQPILEEALSGYAYAFAIVPATWLDRRRGVTDGSGPWRERAMRLGHWWSRMLTRHWLALVAPHEICQLSRNPLPPPGSRTMFPRHLQTLRDEALEAFERATIDPSRGVDAVLTTAQITNGDGIGAIDWLIYESRMRFIAYYFRSRQQYGPILDSPFNDTQTTSLSGGEVPSTIRGIEQALHLDDVSLVCSALRSRRVRDVLVYVASRHGTATTEAEVARHLGLGLRQVRAVARRLRSSGLFVGPSPARGDGGVAANAGTVAVDTRTVEIMHGWISVLAPGLQAGGLLRSGPADQRRASAARSNGAVPVAVTSNAGAPPRVARATRGDRGDRAHEFETVDRGRATSGAVDTVVTRFEGYEALRVAAEGASVAHEGHADLPDWADSDRIANGERFFRTWCVQLTQCLMTASLPTAYASPQGTRVLLTTGLMAGGGRGSDDPLRRRIGRTAATLTTVFNLDRHPDGGLLGTTGRAELERIRALHEMVRAMVTAPGGGWDPSWGTPVDQRELLCTLLSFTTVPLRALERLGFRFDAQGAEDYLHTWAVAGRFLGIADDAIPRTLADAQTLEDDLRPAVLEPNLGGQCLLAALMHEIADLPYFPDPLAPAFVYATAGEDVAAFLGLQPSRASWAIFRLLRTVWSLPGIHPVLTRVSRAVGPTLVKRYISGSSARTQPIAAA